MIWYEYKYINNIYIDRRLDVNLRSLPWRPTNRIPLHLWPRKSCLMYILRTRRWIVLLCIRVCGWSLPLTCRQGDMAVAVYSLGHIAVKSGCVDVDGYIGCHPYTQYGIEPWWCSWIRYGVGNSEYISSVQHVCLLTFVHKSIYRCHQPTRNADSQV